MISLTHTPVFSCEVKSIFRMRDYTYQQAIKSGALQKCYSDYNDQFRRVSHHNLSDLLLFSVYLAYGWPLIRAELLADVAEEAHDQLALAWEETNDEAHNILSRETSIKISWRNHLMKKEYEAARTIFPSGSAKAATLLRSVLEIASFVCESLTLEIPYNEPQDSLESMTKDTYSDACSPTNSRPKVSPELVAANGYGV